MVLVELENPSGHESPVLLAQKKTGFFPFLRALSADIQGARYQKHVMPFTLLTPDTSDTDTSLDAALTEACFGAGALDIIHSPLGYEDINRLVGHVKDAVRPSARLIGSSMARNLVDSIRDMAPANIARHRPDESIPAHRRSAVEDAVRQWHFPAHDFAMDELCYAALYMLEHILQVLSLIHI